MSAIRINWQNNIEIKNKFNRLSSQLQNQIKNEMLKVVTDGLKTGAKRRVHKQTGKLFRSIQSRNTGSGKASLLGTDYALIEDARGNKQTRTGNKPPHDFIRRTVRQDGPRLNREANTVLRRRLRTVFAWGGGKK